MKLNNILNELVLDLKLDDNSKSNAKYEATLNILSKNDFKYTEGYYKGHIGTKYIVGKDKPLGEFRFGHMDRCVPGFDLYDETPRNWFRCMGMIAPIMKDFISHYPVEEIIFSPSGEEQRKRYQSQSLIDHIMNYIGDEFIHFNSGNIVVYQRK